MSVGGSASKNDEFSRRRGSTWVSHRREGKQHHDNNIMLLFKVDRANDYVDEVIHPRDFIFLKSLRGLPPGIWLPGRMQPKKTKKEHQSFPFAMHLQQHNPSPAQRTLRIRAHFLPSNSSPTLCVPSHAPNQRRGRKKKSCIPSLPRQPCLLQATNKMIQRPQRPGNAEIDR